MHLGGWARLGIVLSVLYAVIVAVIAYDGRPRLQSLQRSWFSEATEVVAEAISKKEGAQVTSSQVREKLMNQGDSESTAWFEKVAAEPSEPQKLFSSAVKQVNEKHRALIAKLPEQQREYWLLAFAWWAGGSVLLFATGWAVGWVIRGFRRNAV